MQQTEDPDLKAQRLLAQQRAEDDRTRSIQGQLSQETQRRTGLGTASLIGPLGQLPIGNLGNAPGLAMLRSLIGAG